MMIAKFSKYRRGRSAYFCMQRGKEKLKLGIINKK